jgi:cytochrome c oxidase subunit III
MAHSVQQKKIHPHKFTLWVAIGSIVMMFAGLTSAYIVKSDMPSFTRFQMPVVFYYSTLILIGSSLSIYMAQKYIKERAMNQYRRMVMYTFILGLLFVIMQGIGFNNVWQQGVVMKGSGAGQFMYIIFGLHALHVIAGVIGLLVLFRRAYSKTMRTYNTTPIEIMSTYWHFVDLLWVYLFVFFLWKV